MPVIGTNFTKISIQKFEIDNKNKKLVLNPVENNLNLKNVKWKELNLGKPTKVLSFEYEFKSEYPLKEPSGSRLAEILILGEVLFADEEKELKKMMKDWEDNKKMDISTMETILGAAFDVSKIEIITLASKLMLPLPIEMPRLKKSEEKNKEE